MDIKKPRRTKEGKVLNNWLHNTLKITREDVLNKIGEVAMVYLEKRVNTYLEEKGGIRHLLEQSLVGILNGEISNPHLTVRGRSIRSYKSADLKTFIERTLKEILEEKLEDQLNFKIQISNIPEPKNPGSRNND